MYHDIEFRRQGLFKLEMPGKARLVQFVMKKGARVRAQIKPYVLEFDEAFIEVADLFLEEGGTARAVPFAYFRFLDE